MSCRKRFPRIAGTSASTQHAGRVDILGARQLLRRLVRLGQRSDPLQRQAGPGPRGQHPLTERATLAFGGQNVFNTFPDVSPNATSVGERYSEYTPWGFNGGYYYVRLSYTWETSL